MAKIYISHSSKDRDLAFQIANSLRNIGNEVLVDTTELMPGVDRRSALTAALAEAEVIVALITESSESSNWVMTEIGAARAFQQERGDLLFIPVVFEPAQLPQVLAEVQAILIQGNDIPKAIQQITIAIDKFAGIKAAKLIERKEIQERIEQTAEDYIEEALKSLRTRESRYSWIAFGWYAAGFLALIIGIAAALLLSINGIKELKTQSNQWPIFAYIALKSLIIIGLLIASSKYSFSLGRSYISESLKNSDRLHAISFGRFYLRAYGEKATWLEIKEAFQHWNIAKDSAFSFLDSKEYDPNFIGAAIEIAKAVANRSVGK